MLNSIVTIAIVWSKNDLVFCFQNCSDLLWEKIVPVIEKHFWNSRQKANIFEITRTIYSNSQRSDQFLKQNAIGKKYWDSEICRKSYKRYFSYIFEGRLLVIIAENNVTIIIVCTMIIICIRLEHAICIDGLLVTETFSLHFLSW